ncbi:hypothetical protein L218DRAFT_218231 [Marasmius fiardii PR-910]|nr:hypothetical protein L218DRAFT_218231 [Marasmius fiardii PR-910]
MANPVTKVGIEVVGRNGRVFSEKWASQGPTTLHGCCSNFPSLFWLGPTQIRVTANFARSIDALTFRLLSDPLIRKLVGSRKTGSLLSP